MDMKVKENLENYKNIMISYWIMVFLVRLLEVSNMLLTFGNEEGMLVSELGGFCVDIVCGSAILLILLPLYTVFPVKAKKIIIWVFLVLFSILLVIHILLLQYFFNQHKPLGTLLFGYSMDEILFTVGTANISLLAVFFEILVILALFWTVYFIIKDKINWRFAGVVAVVSLPFALVLLVVPKNFFNDYVKNKSVYFYKEAIEYNISEKNYCHEITVEDVEKYHDIFPEKRFTSDKYPLMHKFDTHDSLGYYFHDFDGKPNVVILIIEGLNDDFVHDYHGLNIMPNLRKLISESLYWDHCFTLGERSFAVVPSVLGSLPYGEIGFTLLDKLPRHLTLTSIFEANGYQTDFFYGQGSWFHKKDVFFKRNNIDLIFDKHKFDEKYEKIVVAIGKGNYFWGYDDKNLFNQSLEIIDTLKDTPRFDVYFTGSTHSPFIISEPEKYDERLLKMRNVLEKNTDRKFYKHYNDYARTLLFLDDALFEFFEKYSQRDDYQNTIFVITGDHPMTEIPPENLLKRYHVPFVIYSPRLKTSMTFKNMVSHLDFFETMMAFMEKYGIERLDESAAFGGNMFMNNDNFAFMNEPRDVVDFYSDGYYISGKDIYKVDDAFNIKRINDSDRFELLEEKLATIRKISEFTSLENYIMHADYYKKVLKTNKDK